VPLALRRRLCSPAWRRSYELCQTGTEPSEVDWVSGACLAARGSTLRCLGGLDTGYFMYYEDEELCVQVRRLGNTVVYLPAVDAIHLGGGSTSDPAQAWPHLYRSLLRFQARHRGSTFGRVRATVLARALVGMALGSVRDALALVAGKPARRARAWRRIARIALVEAPVIENRASG
jgi:N-acetylglucosaminyl-diphospho-decaprenol L-rhamnosyltransferase